MNKCQGLHNTAPKHQQGAAVLEANKRKPIGYSDHSLHLYWLVWGDGILSVPRGENKQNSMAMA